MTKQMNSANRTTPYIFARNDSNNKITDGIENLFDESLFTDEFYIEKPKSDGGYHKSLDKNKFKSHMLTNGTEENFKQFKPLIDKLEQLLSSNT